MGSVTIVENHATKPAVTSSNSNNSNNNNNNNSTTADLQAKQEQAAVAQQPQRGRPALQPAGPPARRRRRYQRQTVLHQHPNGDVSDQRQIMSTGKRLAKRSIIGTRVCAPGDDGKYYSGAISNVITPASEQQQDQGGLHITPYTRYTVKFDPVPDCRTPDSRHEYTARDLIGPGFGNVTDARLVKDQRVYLTHNGREVQAVIKALNELQDEVVVECVQPGQEGMSLTKRIEDIRLLESRKSARLADSDTDFARLADMGTDRKRASSNSIDVPQVIGSRKRRPSSSNDSDRSCNGWDNRSGSGCMDECSAAMVLMSLSTPPKNPLPIHCQQMYGLWDSTGSRAAVGSPGVNGITSPSSSSSASWRSGTPSPPLSDEGPLVSNNAANRHHGAQVTNQQYYPQYQPNNRANGSSSCSPNFGAYDEGIVPDLDLERPRKKRFRCKNLNEDARNSPHGSYGSDTEFVHCTGVNCEMRAVNVFKCSWRYAETRIKCNFVSYAWETTGEHVLHAHLNGVQTHENEVDFYIVDEVIYEPTCSLPTKSHWDMVKPRSEDPEYQKQIRQPATPTQFIPQITTVPNQQGIIINDTYIPSSNVTAKPLKPGPPKSIPAYDSSNISVVTVSLGKLAHSPRRVRGETKKCRKVYGMEHKDLWCTQCKWKKACTRFSD